MLRIAAAVVVGVLLIGFSAAYAGMPEPLPVKVNGSEDIAVIDADDDGQFDEDSDCVFRASVENSDLTITPMQDEGSSTRLRVCDGPCMGNAGASLDFIEIVINQCDWDSPPGGPFVPADLLVGRNLLSSSSGVSGGGTASGNGQVIQLVEGRLIYPFLPFDSDAGDGFLCNLNGPAATVRLRNGVRVVRDLVPFPSNGTPTHLCVTIPFELLGGGFVLRKICFPFNPDGNTDISVGDESVAFLSFSGLRQCGAGALAAPSMTSAGLVALLMVLLAVGIWGLGRRRGFYEGLPLI
jgi:hypothetical protein